MHKTTRIHIAKTPYDIEPDAEVALTQYLAELRAALGPDGAKDTMADIELHITEILAESSVNPNGVITNSEVQAIKEQLGDPAQVKTGHDTADAQVKRRNWTPIVIAGVAAVLLGAAALVWNERLFPVSKTDKTEHKSYTRNITNLDISIESGNIEVRVGQPGQVVLERHLKWSEEKPAYSETWDGEQLRITSDCPENQRHCSLGYVVYVPAGVELTAKTDVGKIDVEGVEGDIRLSTSSGNVDATGTKGDVWSRVSNGNISIEGQSPKVDLQASSGNIDLRFSAAPSAVKAKTASGNIEVIVPFGDAYAVRANTDSGRRTVSVQQDSAANRSIDIKVSSGNVTVQHPQD
jgi:hypothetical protein